jgi:hypothetical protein
MSDSTDPGRTGDGFDDPTAPAWTSPEPAPPTQPIPADTSVAPPIPADTPVAPPSPYTAPQPAPTPDRYAPAPYGQNPYGQGQPQHQPYAPTAYGQNPYGQQPYDPTAYGQTPYTQPYGSTAYGQPPYSLSPAPYGAPPARNTSAIVLTVVSGLALIACCNVFAIPALVLGILGITKGTDDPHGAARMTRAGWITFGVTTALVVTGWVVFFALAASGTFDGGGTYDYQEL